jgi:adhesin HecA-like repeat protein
MTYNTKHSHSNVLDHRRVNNRDGLRGKDGAVRLQGVQQVVH